MLLVAIQTFHTAITYLNFWALFYMIYMHWTGRRTRLLKVAYGLIAVEILALLPFGVTCPLRVWVTERYSADTPDQIILRDIAPYYLYAGSFLLALAVATYVWGPKPTGQGR